MPALKNHEQDFGKLHVWTTELSFTRAARLEVRLGKLVLALAPSFNAGKLKDFKMGGLGSALNTLDGDELIRLMLDVFASTSVRVIDDAAPKGEKVDITNEADLDRCFNGYALEAHEALLWVIGVNFGAFGRGLLERLAKLAEGAKDQNSTSATSGATT